MVHKLQCTLLCEPCRNKGALPLIYLLVISPWLKPRELTSFSVSSEELLWNRLYCAIVSDNIDVISSVLGASVKTSGESGLGTSGACLLQDTNQALDDTSAPEISGQENNHILESDVEANIISGFERREDNLNVNDSNFDENSEPSRINVNEQAADSGVKNERKDVQQSDGETAAKGIVDVINGRFGESGDTLLHVASRSSRTEIVLRLLECGADPAVK